MDYEGIHNIVDKSIEKYSELVDSKFERIEDLLQNIDRNVTKQNGSVARALDRINKLEHTEALHVVNCPHKDIIQELRDERIKTQAVKKYLRNWVVVATAAVNAIIQLAIYIMKQ